MVSIAVKRNGQEIVLQKFAYSMVAKTVDMEIKAGSKREDFESEDTAIFDKIDTDGDKVVSYDELDVFVTNLKKKNDKEKALQEYLNKETSKGERAAKIAGLTTGGLCFAGGAIISGKIGSVCGKKIGREIKKLTTNANVRKVIEKSFKHMGAGIGSAIGGSAFVLMFPTLIMGAMYVANEMFGNTIPKDQLVNNFEEKYVEKEPDKSEIWDFECKID